MEVVVADSNHQSFSKNLKYLFHIIPKYLLDTIQIMELKYAQGGAISVHH